MTHRQDQPPDERALHAQIDDTLRQLHAPLPSLQPLDPDDAAQCRLWRACELCSFLDHRGRNLAEPPDPYSFSDADIDDQARRTLITGERLSDPREMDWYQPYWLVADAQVVGTIALQVWNWGWAGPHLSFASLYIFPAARRQGHARRTMAALEQVVATLGLSALRLETDWLWQPAVRLYLDFGFSVANWKHVLSLVRWRDDPTYRLQVTDDRMDLLLGAEDQCLITARRDGDRLMWQDRGLSSMPDAEQLKLRPEPTLALWLAVSGWPLIRSNETWAECLRWCDSGMPEGLAHKIQVFEGYARHQGLPVRTPRIPGLDYPSWVPDG
jgi:GNAT superfamily N-acetyltransferase